MINGSNELMNIYRVTFHATGDLGGGPTEGFVLVNANGINDANDKAIDKVKKKYPHDNNFKIHIDTIQDIYGGMACKY